MRRSPVPSDERSLQFTCHSGVGGYFVIVSDALYTGIVWDLVFIAINSFHLLRLTHERLCLHAADDDRDLPRIMFEGLDDAQIGMLLNSGSWHRALIGEQRALALLHDAPA